MPVPEIRILDNGRVAYFIIALMLSARTNYCICHVRFLIIYRQCYLSTFIVPKRWVQINPNTYLIKSSQIQITEKVDKYFLSENVETTNQYTYRLSVVVIRCYYIDEY
ncbi:hypothetical protein QTP88_028568 [Uroleucon formosanum]